MRQRERLRVGETAKRGDPLADHPLADHHVADQPPLLAQSDLSAELELAGLADVVRQRGAEEQVGVESGMDEAQLMRQRCDADRVLEQPAEVRVVAGARTRRATELLAELRVAHEGVEQARVVAIVNLARQMLEEAVELL